ncbi:TPA: response regulator transcription factor [Enterococcus faecium]|uniref:Response regulator transcription factor n=7 Tax=Enterococcus TaxID=1350 RepID=A0A367CD25_9ENTE|nr:MULTISPECIES: response regulator transcription factor [Enterococcus]MBC9705107.1 response regulator transcription factor [Enterococcus sp.]HAQ1411609.1 response regulator transcription factor [Enterococcus faecium Ef_aus0030]HAQ1417190.1 response regulator transcription factor [Enterococcus faecium Ef_aus0018]HAQ1582801.1 response regulator transcription factor [Enterococcus faecium Efm-HS0661]ALZ53628.1 two-component system response regulator [Enterococcus faecium]
MRVLVVEDNRELVLSVKKGLEQENISVDVAYDGESGEEKAFINSYDGILLDLNLPKKDGLSVLQSLRAEEVESPVIIITARDEIEERAKGLDFGADDYLVKPFELLELKARIRAVIRRYHGRALPQISIGALKIDPLGRRVSYQKTEVVLKPKEFDILLCIAQRHPAVVSSEEISEHVYDEDFDPFSSVLRVHLARLKKKLAEAAEKEVLKTIRAKGYQLCY